MTNALLTKKDLSKFLKTYPNWSVTGSGKELVCKIKLKKYIDGLTTIARIAIHAELLQHHPEIHFTYNLLTIKLTTHSAKGITKLDTALAEKIDSIIK